MLGAALILAADPPPLADEAALLDGARALLGTPSAPHLSAAVQLMQQPDDLERGLDLLLGGVRLALAGG